MPPPRFCRILLIEDDEVRIERVSAWLPPELRLVVARSPGRAIATLRIDGPQTYAGVMLDHDLQAQAIAPEEAGLSGSDLVRLIIARIDHDVPVLVHSMNMSRGPMMVQRLKEAGFDTSYVPFESLTQAHFLAWIARVYDLWDDA
jgi:CheY-like chemotaxis protein